MATTYVQFTRDEFEDWLSSTGHKWEQKRGMVGVYVVPLSDNVAVEVSSSLTGRDDVVSRAQASMGVRLVSLVTGYTLNKVAQGQDHFKRTVNWRDNLRKGLDRMVDAYRKSSAFYDALAPIKDREAYKRENLAKIEGVSGWERDDFLKSLHDRLMRDGILSQKQLDSLDRATSRAVPRRQEVPIEVNGALLGKVRALYAIGKERGNTWLMDFAKSVGELIKAGRDGTPRQKETLNRLLDEYRESIEQVLRRSPQLSRVSAERVASRHENLRRWALFRDDPAEYERRHGKYAPPGVYC